MDSRGGTTVADPSWTVVVGADDAGFALKQHVVEVLAAHPRVREVVDLGPTSADDPTAYPHVAIEAAEQVRAGRADRALLVCGTGIGVAISANKVPGVRATVAHDVYSVERSVLSNNAQVLCFGARVIAPHLAGKLVAEWLRHEFDAGSASADKLDVIDRYERSRPGPGVPAVGAEAGPGAC